MVIFIFRPFQVSFDTFIEKLNKIEEQISIQEPISALSNKVQVQSKENEAILENLSQQDVVLEKLVQNGQEVVESLEDVPERETLNLKLTELNRKWHNLKDLVTARHCLLSKLQHKASKYREQADSLSSALADAESNVVTFEPHSVDINNIAKQKELLKQARGTVDKIKLDVRELSENAEALKEEAETDVPIVEAEIEDFVSRVEQLYVSLDKKDDQILSLEEAANDYHVTVKKVEDVFCEAYDAVDSPTVFGTDTETAHQQLSKIKVTATHTCFGVCFLLAFFHRQ